jgi:hypothetical protein
MRPWRFISEHIAFIFLRRCGPDDWPAAKHRNFRFASQQGSACPGPPFPSSSSSFYALIRSRFLCNPHFQTQQKVETISRRSYALWPSPLATLNAAALHRLLTCRPIPRTGYCQLAGLTLSDSIHCARCFIPEQMVFIALSSQRPFSRQSPA